MKTWLEKAGPNPSLIKHGPIQVYPFPLPSYQGFSTLLFCHWHKLKQQRSVVVRAFVLLPHLNHSPWVVCTVAGMLFFLRFCLDSQIPQNHLMFCFCLSNVVFVFQKGYFKFSSSLQENTSKLAQDLYPGCMKIKTPFIIFFNFEFI